MEHGVTIPVLMIPHEFGECMEDWHNYEWGKEQEEMDCRRKEEIRKRFSESLEANLSEDADL